MPIAWGSGVTLFNSTWTVFKTLQSGKGLSIQYEDDGTTYSIFAFDGPVVYTCTIWKGTLPDGVLLGGYTQVQNDADKTDFETNYKPYANLPVVRFGLEDPRRFRRFGNVTTSATAEVLVSTRTYNEPASQAQRSVKSTSVQDAAAGSGAKKVRITYLNSSYVLKTEDVTLNGTTAVNTVATDIRFIEKFQVVQGAAAAGAIELFPNTGGTGTAICGIAAGTEDAFLCHHYVPAGRKGFIFGWGAVVDDEVAFKLKGQSYYSTNLVDENWDLYKLFGISTPPGCLEFYSKQTKAFGEKTYIRVTAAPNQTTATVIRAYLDIWEDVA